MICIICGWRGPSANEHGEDECEAFITCDNEGHLELDGDGACPRCGVYPYGVR